MNKSHPNNAQLCFMFRLLLQMFSSSCLEIFEGEHKEIDIVGNTTKRNKILVEMTLTHWQEISLELYRRGSSFVNMLADCGTVTNGL